MRGLLDRRAVRLHPAIRTTSKDALLIVASGCRWWFCANLREAFGEVNAIRIIGWQVDGEHEVVLLRDIWQGQMWDVAGQSACGWV